MPSLILKPGMFVRLKQQPWDLPDFVLDYWHGDTGWVRQQSWGPEVWLRVKLAQLAIPGAKPVGTTPNALKLITVVGQRDAQDTIGSNVEGGSANRDIPNIDSTIRQTPHCQAHHQAARLVRLCR